MILPEDVQASVRDNFHAMESPVTVKLYVKPGEESSETMRGVWQELGQLTDKLILEVQEEVPARLSAEDMEGAVSDLWVDGAFTGVSYLGIPSGHEFGPLIQTLVELSNHVEPTVSPTSEAWLNQLNEPLHLQVFVTPTWPYCPQAVRLAQAFARVNPEKVIAEMIDASSYPDLSGRYGISSVPATIANDRGQVVGAVPEGRLLAMVQRSI